MGSYLILYTSFPEEAVMLGLSGCNSESYINLTHLDRASTSKSLARRHSDRTLA